MMTSYRKKPVVIEAVQFDGTPGGALAVLDHFDIPGGKFVSDLNNLERGTLLIPTLEDGPDGQAKPSISRVLVGGLFRA